MVGLDAARSCRGRGASCPRSRQAFPWRRRPALKIARHVAVDERDPNTRAPRTSGSADGETRILVRQGGVEVKIETSPMARGVVNEPSRLAVMPAVEDSFGFAEMSIVAFEDLCGGKSTPLLTGPQPCSSSPWIKSRRARGDDRQPWENHGVFPGRSRGSRGRGGFFPGQLARIAGSGAAKVAASRSCGLSPGRGYAQGSSSVRRPPCLPAQVYQLVATPSQDPL